VVARRPSIVESAVATGKGDDGTTGLLFGGRIPKDDVRTDAYGAIDEAVAALGVARVALGDAGLADLSALILRLQRELFVVGAELATNPSAVDRLEDGVTRVSEAMLEGLEAELARLEGGLEMPREFVVPGESAASAALEVARTVVRRAERRVVTLERETSVSGTWVVPYINRLADLLWVLARAAERAEQAHTTPARVRP
jgi:cob(I)alamin adenosyltransferase